MSKVLQEFADAFHRCWLCGSVAERCFPPRLEIHHICRGPNRQKSLNCRSTLIRTCPRCHTNKLDGMAVVDQLAIKLRNDPEHYDPAEVNRLRGRAPGAIDDADVLQATMKLYDSDGDYPFAT